MKKIISIILVLALMFTISSLSFSAETISTVDMREDLFSQLRNLSIQRDIVLKTNEITFEEYRTLLESDEYKNVDVKSGSYIAQLYLINQQKENIDMQLERLGSVRLTSENVHLYQDFLDDIAEDSTDVYGNAPNFDVYMDYYSVYITDYETYYKLHMRYGREVRVVVDSYLEVLNENLTVYPHEGGISETEFLNELFLWVFEYIASPILLLAAPELEFSWTILDMIESLSNYRRDQIVSTPRYSIEYNITTQMRYYYMYDAPWTLVAVDSVGSVAEAHDLAVVVDGQSGFVRDQRYYDIYASNVSAEQHLKNYVDTGYCRNYYYGVLGIDSFEDVFYYDIPYAELPRDLFGPGFFS